MNVFQRLINIKNRNNKRREGTQGEEGNIGGTPEGGNA